MNEILRKWLYKAICQSIKSLVPRGVIFCGYHDAFGHQVWNLECYSRKYFSIYKRLPKIVAFQRSSRVANQSLSLHHQRSGVRIIPAKSILSRLFWFCFARWQPENGLDGAGSSNSMLVFCKFSMNDLHVDPITNFGCVTIFPLLPSEQKKAHRLLDGIGVSPGEYFCFHDRNHHYKNSIRHLGGSDDLFTVSSKTFEAARNCKKEDFYRPAALLDEKGIKAVRLGVHSEDDVAQEPVVDSSQSRTDDFVDLALMSYSKFFVGPNSGIWFSARAFNRPVCLINVFPWPWINIPMPKDCLVMPKKLWSTSEKRFLKIEEMVQLETRTSWKEFYRESIFEELSIEVIANTPEEVTSAILEMNDRLDKNWVGPDYTVTQFLTEANVGYKSAALVPSSFVAQNPEIFGHI